MNHKLLTTTLIFVLSVTGCFTSAYGQNKLKGFEWLEGIWFGEFYGEYAQVTITKDYYQLSGSRWGSGETQKNNIDIKERYDRIYEATYLSLGDETVLVGIDKADHSLRITMDEMSKMSLKKIDINPVALKDAQAKGTDWLYGIWCWESFDRLSMESHCTYFMITPSYYKYASLDEKVEYVIKKEKDNEGKVWYCLVDKNSVSDYNGSWKEICELSYPEGEQRVYIRDGALNDWDEECEKCSSFIMNPHIM